MNPGAPAGDTERRAIATAVAARIKDLVGVTSVVRLVEPGSIERSLGKAKRVVDMRQ